MNYNTKKQSSRLRINGRKNMIDLEKDGLTQTIMSLFTGVTPVTISRTINSMKISPIRSPNQRNLRYSILDSKRIISSILDKKKNI